MLDTLILTTGLSTGSFLNELGQFNTLGHIMILHELEHNITLGRIGIETLIALLIVFFKKDNLILTLSHSQIVSSTVHTQGIGFQST